jgi:Flp pilus assembly protein TadG
MVHWLTDRLADPAVSHHRPQSFFNRWRRTTKENPWETASMKFEANSRAARLIVRLGFVRGARRFGGDENAATAVEFSLVALPFIALMFAILETGMMFFAAQTLETAVSNAGRLVRTGQAQSAGLNMDTFKAKICDQIMLLFACTANLKLDVRTFTNFSDMTLTRPVDANGNLKTDDFKYDPGKGGQIVLVRAYYEWPTFVTSLGNNLTDLPDGNRLLAAAAAFRNEPFPW